MKEVILCHNHSDHTGGLLHLRCELAKENPAALSRAHVGKGIFWSRPRKDKEGNTMIEVKPAYEATGGSFIEHGEPVEMYPGVWLTGPVPRVFPERNWPSGSGPVKTPQGFAEDTIPEDMFLVFDTDNGLVVLSGCGHAGIVNTFEYARSRIRRAPAYAAESEAILGRVHKPIDHDPHIVRVFIDDFEPRLITRRLRRSAQEAPD